MGKSKTHYVIPAEVWNASPQKFQSGDSDRCTDAAVGAFIGSSLELKVSVVGQLSNAGKIECPAHPSVRAKVRPKHRYGEFAALKEEVQDSTFVVEGGHSLYELTTVEEIKSVDSALDRFVSTDFGQQLKYSRPNGQQIGFSGLIKMREAHKGENQAVQELKDKLIEDHGCSKTMKDGKVVSPEYSQELLQELSRQNQNLWSATGVNLLIRISGKHTIAKDNNFVQGSLNQQQLDELAAKLNYKETEGFFKGSIRSRTLSIPVQSEDHIKKVLGALTEALTFKDFPEKVNKSAIRLVKVLK